MILTQWMISDVPKKERIPIQSKIIPEGTNAKSLEASNELWIRLSNKQIQQHNRNK
jgi:hypothetical protein